MWDSGNHLIRRINQNRDVTTITGRTNDFSDADGFGANATFATVNAMCSDASGTIYLACGSSVRKLTADTNVVTVAGSFSQRDYADGPGSVARFRELTGLCPSGGILFASDASDHRIRAIAFDPEPQPVDGGSLIAEHYFGVRINGVVGRTYRIESSADMISWRVEDTVLLTSSPFRWLDPIAVGGPKKYYRAFLLP